MGKITTEMVDMEPGLIYTIHSESRPTIKVVDGPGGFWMEQAGKDTIESIKWKHALLIADTLKDWHKENEEPSRRRRILRFPYYHWADQDISGTIEVVTLLDGTVSVRLFHPFVQGTTSMELNRDEAFHVAEALRILNGFRT